VFFGLITSRELEYVLGLSTSTRYYYNNIITMMLTKRKTYQSSSK
jgi:hypothetical protein